MDCIMHHIMDRIMYSSRFVCIVDRLSDMSIVRLFVISDCCLLLLYCSIQDDSLVLSGDLAGVNVGSALVLTVEASDSAGLTTTSLLYLAFAPGPKLKPKP